jgi:alanyl-tRNA synthetase
MSRTSAEVRRAFLEFFEAQGHKLVPSSSLVPQNDPTLMFVNAGMVPFKNVFTGAERPPGPRATSAQKCVRAGGKHNDLDNVGYTGRHQTFFEMMGNFSFGDYFKEGAIELAWEFVSKNLGLPRDRLVVSIHPQDEDAADLWKKIAGFGDSSIIRLEENFWSMGDTGPTGTNTEIFYDHGDSVPGGRPGSPDEDGDRFVEIWNLVFMQWERFADGSQKDLPKPQIDTGMGLERVATVLQGVTTNYDIDLFKTLIEASVDLTGKKADGEARLGLPDRRWGLAVQRGPRLCAAPHHAPRHAACAPARRAGPADVAADPHPGRPDGPGLSRAGPRQGVHRGHPAPGGGTLSPHAWPWHDAARRGDGGPA